MPEDNLGKDFSSQLSSRVVYTDLDSVPNSDEKVLTLKLDFPTLDSFKQFSGQGGEWSGSNKETQWLSNQIYKYDKNSLDKPVTLTTRTYKTTVFDERPMIVIIVKYIIGE